MSEKPPYRPVFNRVLIEREIQEKIGSILIPESQHRRKSEASGIIVAVGPTVDDSLKDCIGKKVIFGKNAGAWLDEAINAKTKEVEGKYYICADDDILCIVE